MKTPEWPRHGFLGLLICLTFVLAITPFFHGYPYIRFVLTFFLTGVLFFSIYSFSKNKHELIIVLSLGVPTFLATWIGNVFTPPTFILFKEILSAIFFSYIIFVILSGIFRRQRVTVNLIYGSICVYLLIGLVWAFMFSTLEILYPGSFKLEPLNPGAAGLLTPSEMQFSQFLYYSYVTLTTLGYGDISPVSPPARSFATLEAIVGQFYLTILVARLVGLQITGRSSD